ncbi:MAG TPA: putative sporulation protein YtxC [Bacillota bacterium]|nr:putative sporulation protein YtxC [Bacillota bacterium]HNU93810.1 putative sporulation protein YtxC [Bacillota bacterium]HNY67628.1 putative sporulation protein YtxC [Bacillota bacterium]HOI36496.1 putative sporulation protein YtxC [Bacillota bacterium]HPU76353.1 putative sporulation protein YtxC [Bacillota bacterium]
MDCVQIGSYLAADSLRRRLFCELDHLRAQGLEISIRYRVLGDLTLIECTARSSRNKLVNEQDLRRLFRRRLANLAATMIFDEVEEALILDNLKTRHPELGEEEAAAVSEYAAALLNEGVDGVLDPSMRLGEVTADVEEYLGDSNALVIEGFVRFRMKEYMEELKRSAEEALIRFMAEREHREFVRLLKYFVDIQDQRQEIVHVVRTAENRFELRGPEGGRVVGDYVDTLASDAAGEGVDVADLLISALITAAPRKVVLHYEPDPATAETIDTVFEGRVERCRGMDCRVDGCSMRCPQATGEDPLAPAKRQ